MVINITTVLLSEISSLNISILNIIVVNISGIEQHIEVPWSNQCLIFTTRPFLSLS